MVHAAAAWQNSEAHEQHSPDSGFLSAAEILSVFCKSVRGWHLPFHSFLLSAGENATDRLNNHRQACLFLLEKRVL